jgi:hypothetical protein
MTGSLTMRSSARSQERSDEGSAVAVNEREHLDQADRHIAKCEAT